jgi:hypothetical protein
MESIERPGFYAVQHPLTLEDLKRFLKMPDHVREQVLNVMRYDREIPTDAEMVRWMTRAERREEASRRSLVVVR